MMKLFNVVMGSIFLAGCTHMATSGFDKGNTAGRDVDEVIVEIEKNGAKCSNKAVVKGFSGGVVGAVNCGIKEKSLVCPKSYGIYLSYDLTTNKITSIFKDERDNCF